jgi:hypothetical protein
MARVQKEDVGMQRSRRVDEREENQDILHHMSPFDLFISYVRRDSVRHIGRHTVDVIEELKRALESHTHPDRLPKQPARRFRVCTDVEDFSLKDTVDDAIRDKIDQSHALIVICSNGAYGRQVIHDEIAYFCDRQERGPLLAAVLDCQPHDAVPEAFGLGTMGVDLAITESLTFRSWRRKILAESHKIVERVWALPTGAAYDRFEQDRREVRRRQLLYGAVPTVAALVFGISYWTWLHCHRYAVLGEGTIQVMQGYPGLGGPGFPRLLWEEPIQPPALALDSPLRRGQPAIAFLGTPDALIRSQLGILGTISFEIAAGRTEEARRSALSSLSRAGLQPEEALFSRLLLTEVADARDSDALAEFLRSDRSEVRTAAMRALLRIDPASALPKLTASLEDQNLFDHRGLLQAIPRPCLPETVDYISRARATGQFANERPRLLDTAARVGCRLDVTVLTAFLADWPILQMNDFARYVDLLKGDGDLSPATTAEGHRRWTLWQALSRPPRCELDNPPATPGGHPGNLQWSIYTLWLLSPGCQPLITITTAQDDTDSISIRPKNDGTVELARLPAFLSAGDALTLIEPLALSGDIGAGYLKRWALSHPDGEVRAQSTRALRKSGRRFELPSAALASNTLALRQEAYVAKAVEQPRDTYHDLVLRIGDQELVDFPEIVGLLPSGAIDLNLLRPFMREFSETAIRAAAVLAIFGNESDYANLATRPQWAIRKQVAEYAAANANLAQIVTPSSTIGWSGQLIPLALVRQRTLGAELALAPAHLRAWRAGQILSRRRDAFDSRFARILDRGSIIWLRRVIESEERPSMGP